ncbi:hypothetical protein RRF68_00180 [Tenacibaculum sp. HL-MS23]|uniref:hypothetical protein n=1 Tax=Tenacibaculum sp. HL-MS23 TaxID=3077734 RepID=UPI0028FC1BAB|nr:hypothetical protein [Tenacibaculum sp. HL-MS23]WNW01862.1 hypothetical protein RRF68_00180 [Tenacibaculum sp. HL-MS23]
MGKFSDIEIKILDRLTEVIDGVLESIGYENSEKDRMLYSTCINDDEKDELTKKEIKKLQKKISKCNPNIAGYISAFLNKYELEQHEGDFYSYRERISRNFLSNYYEGIEQLSEEYTTNEKVDAEDEMYFEAVLNDELYNFDKDEIDNFIKYMAYAQRLSTFKSILESVEEEKAKKEISKEPDQPIMINNQFQYNNFKDLLLVEELEKRIAIEAVEYKKNCDDYWETYTFDPTYFDAFISGELYTIFLNAIYERIKPLNDFEINKYLTLSVNQFKTHIPQKRAEAFKRIYHDTYWHPNYMEYNPNQYENKYPVHVWKHYTNHFHLFKEASENILQDFKKGLIGSGRKQEVIEKPKTKTKSKHQSFTYINNLTGQTQLTDLMNTLKRKNLIDNSTDLKDFRKAFSGEEIEKPIVWTGNISELSYFIKQLHNELKLVENLKQQQWAVTINCFVQENGEQYNRTKLRTQKVPTTSKYIDMALKTL